MSNLDDVVDPPDQRDQVERHEGARIIVLGHLHLGQAETLRCTLKQNKIHKQYSTAFFWEGGVHANSHVSCLNIKLQSTMHTYIITKYHLSN